jgi:hypothetical protein
MPHRSRRGQGPGRLALGLGRDGLFFGDWGCVGAASLRNRRAVRVVGRLVSLNGWNWHKSVGSPVDDSAGDQENSCYHAGDHGDPSAPPGQPIPEAFHGGGSPLRSCRVPEQREL